MTKMNPELKSKWIGRLRSGDYEQGRSHLNAGGKFCCLGVLCDMLAEEGTVEAIPLYHDESRIEYRLSGDVDDVPGRYGLSDGISELTGVGRYGELSRSIDGQDSLADLNDEGMTFKEIADIIEKRF